MSTTSLLPAAPAPEVLPELERLQGAWTSIAGRRAAELFVAGQHFTARFLDGDLYMGTFELHPEQHPSIMVMHIDEGPAKHRGKNAWCIYDVVDDILRWCPAEPGSGERLIAFPAVTDCRYLSTVFRHEHPRKAKRVREE